MNCLYNGVLLPDIYKVYTAELQKTHPYAYVTYGHFTDGSPMAFLYICSSTVKKGIDNGLTGILNTKKRFYASAAGTSKEYVYSPADGHTGFEENEAGSEYAEGDAVFLIATDFVTDEDVIWTNTDLYTTDGTLYLAASDPIPVGGEPIDPTSFMQGYIVGRRLAGMRKS